MKPSRADPSAPLRLLATVRWPVGGIRTYLKYVYTRLDPQAFDITVVAPDIPELRVLMDEMDRPNVHFRPIADARGLGFLRGVTRAVVDVRPHVVQSHGFTAATTTAIPARLAGARHVVTPHDVITRDNVTTFRQRMQIKLLAAVLGNADVVQTVGEDSRRNLLEYMPSLARRAERFRVILNGVPVTQFAAGQARDLRDELGLTSDTYLVGFLGRFMKQKGFTYLMDAMQSLIVRSDLPRRPVVVAVGGGGHIREEQSRVEKRGLGPYVRFLPFEPNVAAVLRGLDVVAIPSLWEACPLLPMEAMMLGTPVVGSDCVGLREVLQGTPATMVPSADADALANALARHLDGSQKTPATAYAPEARRRFDVDTTAASLAELLLAVSSRPPATGRST